MFERVGGEGLVEGFGVVAGCKFRTAESRGLIVGEIGGEVYLVVHVYLLYFIILLSRATQTDHKHKATRKNKALGDLDTYLFCLKIYD